MKTVDNGQWRQMALWIGALIVGGLLGVLGVEVINDAANFIASVYTRLFQLLAVPTIALAVVTTLASFGRQKETWRIFRYTITYTLLTTFCAAVVGLLLFLIIRPENISGAASGMTAVEGMQAESSVADHILSVIPNNIIKPFAEGNVLAILLIAIAVGLGIASMPEGEEKNLLSKGFAALQSLIFILIRALIRILPLGIAAFAAQLVAQTASFGSDLGASLGRYAAVVLCGNAIQFFIVLPLFLLAHRINPLQTLRGMMPAVLMALFTKSSAATLPVTMDSAEQRVGVSRQVSRFVLPICTTINMNGCAAFILVTSLFVMQNGGMELSLATMLVWLLIAVISAIGNAGVPMGCYFLTFSLMSGIGAPLGVMGIILPLFTIIDMIETAENVWSDSCVCTIVNRRISSFPA